MLRIDPHTHSRCSDGTDTPLELLRLAREQGLDVIGATDHDTFDHWEEFRAAHQELSVAAANPPAVILGTEISTNFDHTQIHLLAYLSDPERGALRALLSNVVRDRTARLQAMTEKISRDYPLSWDEVLAQVKGLTPGRPHLADALVARGYFPDRSAAFQILGPDAPYYVRRPPVDTLEVIEATVSDGGVAVLAHTFSSTRHPRRLHPDSVRRLAQAGLAGIEVWHREHDAAQSQLAQDLASELGLFTSGSSDYHGRGKPNRLGENLMPPKSFHTLVQQGAIGLLGELPSRT